MFPNSEYLSDHTLSLPFWSGMPDADVERIAATVTRVLAKVPVHA
jgi:dTDP-4-amino-4,6-dideoxygalactose transaminase